MKKILHISTSVKGANSSSIKLANAIIEKIQSVYPGSEVTTHDLTLKPFPHLEESHITSFYTPEEMKTDANREALKHSDAAIKEVKEADIIVIGIPLYNFGVPSALKAWIDHVVRVNATFHYVNGVPVGLLKDKKVYLALSSGGVYSEGPMQSYDFAIPYLKAVLGFIGLPDVTAFRVEGTSMPTLKETALSKAVEAVNNHAF